MYNLLNITSKKLKQKYDYTFITRFLFVVFVLQFDKSLKTRFVSIVLKNGKGSELRKSERQKSKRTSKIWKGSERRKFPLKGSERQKTRMTTTTYGVVPMDTKACGGLG